MQDETGSGGVPSHRRQAPRLELDYDLKVDVAGDNIPYTGMIKDISTGGIFVKTDKRHRVGEEIQLRFTFPSLDDAIEAKAMVQWVRDEYSAGDMTAGIGVQFVSLPDDISAKINRYIKDKEVPFYDEGF